MYDGRSRFQTSSVRSIAALIADAATAGKTGICNCADADSPTTREIGETICRQMSVAIDFVPVAGAHAAVGRSPWAVPRVFTQSNGKAHTLGIGSFGTYATEVAPTVRWPVENQPLDWQRTFVTLAAYPYELFDYGAEDRHA